MQTPPLPNRIGTRLDELNRQINRCLQDIRRHLDELEAASRQSASGSARVAPRDFAQILKQELDKPAPPASGA